MYECLLLIDIPDGAIYIILGMLEDGLRDPQRYVSVQARDQHVLRCFVIAIIMKY